MTEQNAQQVGRAISWSVVIQVTNQLSQLCTGFLLWRLLSPSDFGLFGMVMVFAGFFRLFSELGLGAAIIQQVDEADDIQLSTIFWLNLGVGVGLASLQVVAAPMLADFYHQPGVVRVAWALSGLFVLSALGVVQEALFRRRLEVKTLAICTATAAVGGSAVAVCLALMGHGVWALVARLLTNGALTAVMLWALSPWRPKLQFKWRQVQGMLQFGKHLLGFNGVNYAVTNVDNAMIGRVYGEHAMGVYSEAYKVMQLPLREISGILSRVMFPVFSRLQHDHAQMRAHWLKSIRAVSLLSFPILTVVCITARPLVMVLFGDEWLEMIPILRVLSLLGMLNSVATTTGWIYMSTGRTDLMLRWELGVSVFKLAGIFLGLPYGPFGVAVGYAVVVAGLFPGALYFSGRLIGMRVRTLLLALLPTLAAATIVGVALWLGLEQTVAWLPGEQLGLLWPGSIVVYLTLIHLVRLSAYVEVLGMIRAYIRGRRQSLSAEG